MAQQEYNATRRVPKAMLKGRGRCITMPVDNDYQRGRHSFKRGQILLVDMEAVPQYDDFVVVMASKPYGRICDVAPLGVGDRSRMLMGTLDLDGDTIHMIELGRNGREFGVVVGVVP